MPRLIEVLSKAVLALAVAALVLAIILESALMFKLVFVLFNAI